MLPNRHTVQTSSDYDANGNKVYRYGYQGSEKDFEIANVTGAHITTHFREYDTRLARTWSVDPVEQPWQTPYASMDNNPILLNDPLGNVGNNPNDDKETGGGVNGNGQYKFGGNTNTQKGLLNASYTPSSFTQLFGSAKWKEQNDLAYLPEGRFDETSGNWALNFTVASSLKTSFSVGLGLSRAKGGFLGADGNQHTHFYHGSGILGGNAEFGFQLADYKSIGLSGSFSLIAGPAIGGYTNGDDRFSSPFIRLGGGSEGFGVRGYGGALYAGLNLSIGSSFLQKAHGSDIFKITLNVSYGVHTVRYNSYSNLTTNTSYPSKTLGLSGVGGGVKFSYDISKPRTNRNSHKPNRRFK